MKKQKDIIKSPSYWFEKIQNELFSQLYDYMKETNKTQTDIAKEMNVTKGYISQILNGNFNPTLKKLVEFVIFLGKVPDFNFVNFDVYLTNNKYTSSEQFESEIKYFMNEKIFEDISLSKDLLRYLYPIEDKLQNTQTQCLQKYTNLSDTKELYSSVNDLGYLILFCNPKEREQLQFVEK